MATTEGDQQAPAPPRKRLTRSRDDRVLGGVCGGLGRYFDIDPVIFRIGFVALLFVGGASLLLYPAAWILLPEEGGHRSIGESWLHHGAKGRCLPITLIVIGAGVVGLLAAADVVSVSVPVFLAGALVLTGVALVAGAWFGRTRGLVALGIVLTVVLALSTGVRASFSGGAGERRWVPASLAELRHTYRLGAGDAVLDLSHLTSLELDR